MSDERLVKYAIRLERRVAILEGQLAQAKLEAERLRELRIRDREIAAYYRAIVEGDVA